MAEAPRDGVVPHHLKGSGRWHLLTLGIFSVPGRRVVPQHGAVRRSDDHGRDAVHGLHLQPLCYQRGSVSAFLLLVPEEGVLCPGIKLLPHALTRLLCGEARSCSPSGGCSALPSSPITAFVSHQYPRSGQAESTVV